MALPAPPILASTLLRKSSHDQLTTNIDTLDARHDVGSNWDLVRDIDLGVPSSSLLSSIDDTVFSCGRVVGISGLSSANDLAEGNEGAVRGWVGELSLHILANTLANTRSSQPGQKAFVVQYLDSRPISQESLYHALQQRLSDQPPTDIADTIPKVQLYQTFEFDDILEAVARISDALYNIQQQRNTAASTTQGESPETRNHTGGQHEPVLVILEGIDRSLEEIIRTSNSVAAQAKLIPLLRTLTILSRTYSSFVTVLVVNAIPLPSTIRSPDHGQQGRNYQPAQREQPAHPLIPVQSIFAQAPGPGPETASSGAFQRPATSYASILARSFDQGFDTHLLVSRVQGKMVIEVGKDRIGRSLGRWCAL